MGKDPYQYFRIEAREILDGMGRGVLRLENEPTPDLASMLLRHAHTLKGAARVVKQSAIAEQAHAIEDLLEPLRAADAKLSPACIDQVLALLDGIAAAVTALDHAKPVERAARANLPLVASDQAPAPSSVPATEPAPVPIGRTDIADMDALLDSLSEVRVQLRAMRPLASAAERGRHVSDKLLDRLGNAAGLNGAGGGRGAGAAASAASHWKNVQAAGQELRALVGGMERELIAGLDAAERQLQQVQNLAEQLRLLPARALFGALERTARDAAHTLGKRVTFQATGGDVRLDAHVLDGVQGALIQVVRNAVAHGIEEAAERTRAGKIEVGRVEIEVVRRGARVAFVCRDDGRGIDVAAVQRVAQERGATVPHGQALDVDAIMPLLLRGGLTTSGRVTEVSGRGIGLDVVRDTCARLGGEVRASSHEGTGTTFELVVPVSMSSLDALLVEAGGGCVGIPLDAIRRTLRLSSSDVARTADGEAVVFDGEVLPFVSLSGILQKKSTRVEGDAWTVLIVAGTSARAAVGVERLRGSAKVIVRPLPRYAPADPVVFGAALDGDGNPQLVLDPEQLVLAAHRMEGARAPFAPQPPVSVLVVDDSLTTRMLEQSILESAGYEVELATCAEEGMEKARARRYQIFLVDVEMPGMDGFTFVEKTRADPSLRDTPAILVTSRNLPGDKERGAQAGASGYVVKGEFDQGRLLEMIQGLVN